MVRGRLRRLGNEGMKKRSALFSQLVRRRGLTQEFLSPKYEDLSDPFLLSDMTQAVERILLAVERGEKVVVYGDYDVDGVTASVVMKEALGFAGVKEVEILLPDRFVDGYGMNEGAVKKIVTSGAGLVVTVDCGSGSGKVISALKKKNVDCVVTDHHEILEMPEDAVAVVNPKREDYKVRPCNLAGVGVAFKVAQAVNMRMNGGVCNGQEKWLLDLVAIGTVCDSMVLTGENRILTVFGMKVLGKTRRAGLIELIKLAGVQKINTHAIGFQIGPRLNASGRMQTATKSLRLMLADGQAGAFALAKELEDLNKERRTAQDKAIGEIESAGISEDPVLVARGDCHEGVVGIVAGRLTERYRRPSFVFAEVEGGLLKGSGRSFGEFALADCITHCQKILVTGGGHNFACGVTIASSNYEQFKTAVNEYYRELGLKNQERFLMTKEDLVVEDLGELTEDFLEELSLLEPYGEGNPEPVFKLCGVLVLSTKRMGAEGKHLRLDVRGKDGGIMKLIAFCAQDEWFAVEEGEKVDVLVGLEMNEWNGVRTVEGKILSVERTDSIW